MKMKEVNELELSLQVFFSISRLYTEKGHYYQNVLSTSSAYKNIMKNNVDLEVSFNYWNISKEKTLKEPKKALFSNSRRLLHDKSHCQVKMD